MIDLLLRKISHVLIENSYWVNNVNLRQSFKSWANFLVSVKLVSFHMILNLDSFMNGPRLSYHVTSDYGVEKKVPHCLRIFALPLIIIGLKI